MPIKNATKAHTGTAAGKKMNLSGVEVFFCILVICRYLNISSLDM